MTQESSQMLQRPTRSLWSVGSRFCQITGWMWGNSLIDPAHVSQNSNQKARQKTRLIDNKIFYSSMTVAATSLQLKGKKPIIHILDNCSLCCTNFVYIIHSYIIKIPHTNDNGFYLGIPKGFKIFGVVYFKMWFFSFQIFSYSLYHKTDFKFKSQQRKKWNIDFK